MAAQPCVVNLGLALRDGRRTAQIGHAFEAAQHAGIIRSKQRLPDAHSQNSRHDVAQTVRLRRLADVPGGIGRKFSILPDQLPVPVKLIAVVDLWDEQGQFTRRTLGPIDGEVVPVPRKPGVAVETLRTPGFVRRDLLPLRVVEPRRCPDGIVPGLKLPGAVERNGVRAEALKDMNGDRRRRTCRSFGGMRGNRARSETHKQPNKGRNRCAGKHGESILRLRYRK